MNERMKRLQNVLAEAGLNGAFYAPSAAMQYLLNDTSYWWQRTEYTGGLAMFAPDTPANHAANMAEALLYIPASGEPVLFATPARVRDMMHIDIKKEIDYFCNLGEELSDYAKEGCYALGESCRPHVEKIFKEEVNPNITFVDGENFVEKMRMVKDADEIQRMRRVAAFTDEAMGKITQILRPGISSYEVQKFMVKLAKDAALMDMSFPPAAIYVECDGPYSQDILSHPKHDPLKPGTSIGFDFGYVVDGYCSDFGRSFYCGKAPDWIEDAYKALVEAQMVTISKMKPGEPMNLFYNTLYEVMEKYGCGKYLRKVGDFGLMGHQIGIDVHERPWLHTDQTEIFQPGMVMCVEPKYWKPGKCFMRVEDMVLITETGAEPLTNYSREQFSLPLD